MLRDPRNPFARTTRLNISLALLLMTAAGLTFGCAQNPPAIRSLDGIAHSRERIDPTQNVLMSLHSLSVDPGTTLVLPADNRRATASALVEHTSGETSYLRIETFEATASEQDMKTIRTTLDDLTRAIGGELRARIRANESLIAKEQAKQQVAEAKAEKNTKEAEKKALDVEVKAKQSKLKDVRNLKDTVLKKDNVPSNSLLSEVAGLSAIEAELQAESQKLESKSSEKNAELMEAGRKMEAAERALQAADSSAKAEIADADKNDADFSEKQKALLQALSNPNIVVFRWNDIVRDQQAGGIAGTFQNVIAAQGKFEKDATKELTGYGVMNGFRRVRLVVGQDLVKGNANWKQLSAIAGLRGNDGVVVTSVIQTRELMYLSGQDLSESLRAKLDALAGKNNLSDGEISSVLDGTGLSGRDKIKVEIQAKLDSLKSLQNNAYLSSPRRVMIPIDWKALRAEPGSLLDKKTEADPRFSGWITIHAVTTKLDELMSQRGDGPTSGYSN